MATRLYQPKSVLEQIPDSLHFAWSDPEQRFEWNTMTRRRVFRNLCNYPVAMGEWKLRDPSKPLFPSLSGDGKSPDTLVGHLQSNVFTGLLFKNALDAGVKFGLASFVKTATLGYHQNDQWRRLIACGDELLALSHTARLSDPSAQAQASLYAASAETPLRRLYEYSQEAGMALARFASGDLVMTDDNIRTLRATLESMALLCEQKAGIPAAQAAAVTASSPHAVRRIEEVARDVQTEAGRLTLAHAPEALMPRVYAAHGRPRPSDHIRAVLTSATLATPAQAELFLSTLSALVTDGAFELETEEFRPKEGPSLNASESMKIAKVIEGTLNRRQIQLNRDAQGNALIRDLPTDIMIKVAGRPALLAAEEVTALANEVKAQLGFLGPRIDRMLAYADMHYADIDGLLGQGVMRTDRLARHERQRTAMAQPLAAVQNVPTAAPVAAMPSDYYKTKSPGLDYVMRDQARHEMWKLYGRSLPTYLWQVPVNLAQRMILKKGDKFLENAKVVGYQAAVYPVSESFAGVAAFEASRLGTYATVNHSRRMDEFLAAAVNTARNADPAFQAEWEAVHASDIMQKLAARYESVLTKPEAQRTAEDYAQLAKYFHESAAQVNALHAKAYAMVSGGRGDFDGFKEHTLKVLSEGAKTTPDALKVLSLVRFIREVADEQILSMEFVDPTEVVADRAHLDAIANHALKMAERHGFAVSGQAFAQDGAMRLARARDGRDKPGELLVRTADGGFRLATKDELIAYANELVAFLRSKDGLDVPRLFDVTVGRLSDSYMHRLEDEIMQSARLPGAAPKASQQIPSAIIEAAPLHPLKTRPFQLSPVKGVMEHIFRPEAMHEMAKLRDRQFFVSLFGFPVKLVENLLSEKGFETFRKAFTGSSLLSTAFKAVADTLTASYGSVAARELALLPHQHLLATSQEASDVLRSAIGAAGRAAPDMRERFIAATGLHPLLGRPEVSGELKRMADVLALPPEKRGEEERTMLQHSAAHVGHALIEGTLTALTGPHAKALPAMRTSTREQLITMLEKPAQDMPQAVMLLAAVDALVSVESQAIGVLRYQGVSHRMLGNKPLDTLVNYIADRAYSEGFHRLGAETADHRQHVSEAQIIAFANDVAAHARSIVQEHTKEPVGQASRALVAALAREQQRSITQSL